ncbi:MAG: hypothetical protein NTY67_04255 [Cyanobacteria bacterium]|nr:hypothetical protein [Cyanobacteriota bacterium]
MALIVAPSLVEPVARGLLGSVSANEGPTLEQRRLLQAFVSHLWSRPDLMVDGLEPLGPPELLTCLVDPQDRQTFHQLQMTLEFCRHPQTPEQLQLGETYAMALGVSSAVRSVAHDLLHEGIDKAAADVARTFNRFLPLRSEPALAQEAISTTEPELDLARRIQAFSELPEGSLGRGLMHYYERFGIPIPGLEPCALNHLYVAHDSTHVIAGIAVTDAGEIALSAFQLAMQDNPINQSALLASLITHEAVFVSVNPAIQPSRASLDAPLAAQMLAQEMARGSRCSGDFSLVDHFSLAPMPLEEVRRLFNVQAPADPDDGHHFLW